MTVKMILAVDHGNSIGWTDGRLPWKLPADMKRFKDLTTGHDLLMGRKTFESFKRPDGLPNRRNNILSESLKLDTSNVKTWSMNIADFVQVHQACLGCTPSDLWVVGGATIYQQAIEAKVVDEIYLTLVHAQSGADVLLPFDLWDYKQFIVDEANRSVQWKSSEPEFPPVGFNDPKITFIKLKKMS